MLSGDRLQVFYVGHGACGAAGLQTLIDRFQDKVDVQFIVNHREDSDDGNAVPALADGLGIPYSDARTEDLVHVVQELQPDVGIIMRHPHKIKPKFYERFPLGVFNTHPSLLPRHRGVAPLEYTVLDQGLLYATSFQIREQFDDGPILCTSDGQDARQKYVEDLFPIAITETVQVMGRTIDALLKGDYSLTPQDEIKATEAKRKDLPKKLHIDFAHETAETILTKLFARSRKNTALPFGTYHGHMFDVHVEALGTTSGYESYLQPGDIEEFGDNYLVQCRFGGVVVKIAHQTQPLEEFDTFQKLNALEVPFEFRQQY